MHDAKEAHDAVQLVAGTNHLQLKTGTIALAYGKLKN